MTVRRGISFSVVCVGVGVGGERRVWLYVYVCLSTFLSVYLSACLSTFLCVCLSVCVACGGRFKSSITHSILSICTPSCSPIPFFYASCPFFFFKSITLCFRLPVCPSPLVPLHLGLLTCPLVPAPIPFLLHSPDVVTLIVLLPLLMSFFQTLHVLS